MRKLLLTSLLFLFSLGLIAQTPGARRPAAGGGQNFNMGHLYGKVVDNKTGKGIDGVSIQLIGNRPDSTGKPTPATLKASITKTKGEFSLENLPVMGNFTLRLSAIGYKT